MAAVTLSLWATGLTEQIPESLVGAAVLIVVIVFLKFIRDERKASREREKEHAASIESHADRIAKLQNDSLTRIDTMQQSYTQNLEKVLSSQERGVDKLEKTFRNSSSKIHDRLTELVKGQEVMKDRQKDGG